ncbi:MAG: hypothetical protein PF485_00895 [Bacteroidales bacterium]|jgi:hypothetical protein|nr:hypothetical protein [Bacteroidales bacterium]
MQPLLELIEFEKQIQDLKVSKDMNTDILLTDIRTVPFKIYKDINDVARYIKLGVTIDTNYYECKFDRQIMHQIGNRVWPKKVTFREIAEEWFELFKKDFENIKNIILNVFKSYDMTIRYIPSNNHIYGIVSNNYCPSNQLHFRERFLDLANKTGIIKTETSRFKKQKNYFVEEYFDFDSADHKINVFCSIIYGKNNGYRSYHLRWHRKCKENLWLTPFDKKDEYQWKNNSFSNLDEFIDFIIQEGKDHLSFLDERVKISQETEMTDDFLDFFLEKFLIAYATKDKIRDQYKVFSERFGKTTWALSSSLRFLGTNDKYTQLATRWLLLEKGTIAIEEDFHEYVKNIKNIVLTGQYEIF